MKNALSTIVLSAAVTAVLAGCGPPPAATGTVTGVLVRVGGPAPGAPVPLPGKVVAVSSDGARYTATTGRNGRYSLSLPPGSYQLTGHSRDVRSQGVPLLCAGRHAVHVAARRTESGNDVICAIR
jgi:hypothetical protein